MCPHSVQCSEEWRQVFDSPKYEVSNLGRVRGPRGVMKPYDVNRREPYQYVRLHGRNRRVHHLVLEAFIGPRPEGMETRHIDRNPRNNVLSNLRWGTKLENAADKHRHGTMLRGERHHWWKGGAYARGAP
jgi:hypothetical protein